MGGQGVAAGGVLVAIVLAQLQAATITIDPSQRFQVMDGFGTGVAVWMDEPYNDTTIQQAYAQDLGVSIVRCDLHPAALCGTNKYDCPPVTFGPDIEKNAAMLDFTAKEPARNGKFAAAVYRRRLDDMRVTFSIWTPPHWMKSGPKYIAQGNTSFGGHLTRTDENRLAFGRYVAAYLKGWADYYKVPIYSLSVQNELGWVHSPDSYTASCQYFNSLYPLGAERTTNGPPLGEDDYIPALLAIRHQLDSNRIAVRLMGPEHGDIASNYWQLWQQMSYINDIAKVPEALKALEIFCHHGYGYSPGAGGRKMCRAYWDGYADKAEPALNWTGIKAYNKPSWMTECCFEGFDWASAMGLANKIQDQVVDGNLSAYVYWLLSHSNDASQGLMQGKTLYTKKYFVLKHFARYIRPGAVRVGALPDDPAGVSVSAFLHEKKGLLTVVIVNNGGAQNAALTLPEVPSPVASVKAYRTSGSEDFVDAGALLTGSSVSLPVPALSLTTLVATWPVANRVCQPAPPRRRTPGRPGVCATRLGLQPTGVTQGAVVDLVNCRGASVARRPRPAPGVVVVRDRTAAQTSVIFVARRPR